MAAYTRFVIFHSQEFLAALDLSDPSATRRRDQILNWFLNGDDWWRVLSFHIGLSKKPDEIARWVRKSGKQAAAERVASLLSMLKASFPAFEVKSSKLRT